MIVRYNMKQWEGVGDVGSARNEPAQHPPTPTTSVLVHLLGDILDFEFMIGMLHFLSL